MVLHTRGSHGPLYSARYPDEFEKFKPVCKNKNLDECKYEELVNAYDNTIHYSSYVIAQIIDILQKNNDNFNSILFFVSDHGESLGEDGQFMHGTPYNSANDFQKQVPFFMWLSKDFERGLKLNKQCLKKKSSGEFSQDYIFHSLLGVFNIKSPFYNGDLDIFKDCKQ